MTDSSTMPTLGKWGCAQRLGLPLLVHRAYTLSVLGAAPNGLEHMALSCAGLSQGWACIWVCQHSTQGHIGTGEGPTSATRTASMAPSCGSILLRTSRNSMCRTSSQVRARCRNITVLNAATPIQDLLALLCLVGRCFLLTVGSTVYCTPGLKQCHRAGENGGRSDTRWMTLSDENGAGIAAVALTKPMQVNATRSVDIFYLQRVVAPNSVQRKHARDGD